MNEDHAAWFLPGEGSQPAGPFTAEQVLDAWRAGKIAESTLCWREGLPDWLPLTEVGVFAETIEVAKHDPNLIRFQCPNPQCSNLIIMAVKFAGRQAKCQVCGQAVTVPLPTQSATALPPRGHAAATERPATKPKPGPSGGVEVLDETGAVLSSEAELPVFARAEESSDPAQVAAQITAQARRKQSGGRTLLCIAIVLALLCTGAVVSIAAWMWSEP